MPLETDVFSFSLSFSEFPSHSFSHNFPHKGAWDLLPMGLCGAVLAVCYENSNCASEVGHVLLAVSVVFKPCLMNFWTDQSHECPQYEAEPRSRTRETRKRPGMALFVCNHSLIFVLGLPCV